MGDLYSDIINCVFDYLGADWKEIIKDVDERIERARKIVQCLEDKRKGEFTIGRWGDYIIASQCDEQYSMYGVTVMSLDDRKDLLKPCVINKEYGRIYRYQSVKKVYEDMEYSNLLEYAILGTGADNIIITNEITDSEQRKYRINHANKAFNDLIKGVLHSDEDKKLFYEEKGGKVKRINPYRILSESRKTDYIFERKLRAIVLELADRDEGKIRSLLFVDKNTKNAEDLLANCNYNNWLINECVQFNEKKGKGIDKASDEERTILESVIGILRDHGCPSTVSSRN